MSYVESCRWCMVRLRTGCAKMKEPKTNHYAGCFAGAGKTADEVLRETKDREFESSMDRKMYILKYLNRIVDSVIKNSANVEVENKYINPRDVYSAISGEAVGMTAEGEIITFTIRKPINTRSDEDGY